MILIYIALTSLQAPLWSDLAEEVSLAVCLGVSSSVEEEHSEVRLPFLSCSPGPGPERSRRWWASGVRGATVAAGRAPPSCRPRPAPKSETPTPTLSKPNKF